MSLQNDDSSSNDPTRAMHKAKSTPLGSILICALLAVFFTSLGIIFLASPIWASKILYPCLSAVEHDDESPNNSRLIVESDAIRLAGACLLSIGLSSSMLLIPLLRCCHYGEKQDAGDREYLGDFFFLRIMFFLQATMGLSLLGAGLINLEKAENDNSYGGGQSNDNDHHFHCSSLKDQSILWVGVCIVCLTSIGMMFSFWPQSPSTEYLPETINNSRLICRCCKEKKRRVHSTQLESSISEPLLQSHDQSLDSLHVKNNTGDEIELDVNEADMRNERTEDERTTIESAALNPSQEQSSRLRGTRRLLKLAGRQSLFLWVGIGVLLIRLPFSLAIPHYVSSTIGDLINEDYDGAKRSVLLLFLLGTVDSVLDFWCIFLFGYAKENIVKGVRIDTFASILSQDQGFFDKTNTGDLNSRLTADCGEMAGDLTWFFRFSVEAAVRIVGIATYMLIRSPFLGLCTILIVPAVGVINKVYGDWLSKNASSVQNSLAEASTVAHESLACIKTVITSATENYESEKYATKIDDLYALNIRQIIAQGIYFMVVSTFLINTCVQSALLLIGSVLVDEGRLTPEVLLSFMLYQGQLQEYTLNLFQSYSSLIKSSGAGDRVFFLLDREPPPPGTGNPLVKSLMTPSTTATTSENIAIRSVNFSYPTRPDTLVLRNFCLEIKQGSLVALVGTSGGGKSTVISLLERLYDPNEGTIEFGNVDLKQMNLKAHREKIGLVTQDPVLFSGTIRENIGYGSSATLEEVVEAAKVANAHNFIESFPKKYDELVGERGMNLSGGQKQRIAIARAIVKKPGLLLLDEATSALDSESEAAVQAALNDLLGNRAGMTTVVIAHRLQTVRNADTIAVLKNGEVVEQGTHEELLQISRGNYRRMIDRADSMGVLPE